METKNNQLQSVYLDHAAATPVHPEVMLAMQPYWSEKFGNPNSLHRWGREAHAVVETARQELSEILQTSSARELIFTASATESNNLALAGVMRAARAKNPDRNHLIVSCIEHDSNLQAARALEKEGFSVSYLPGNNYGQITAPDLAAAIQPGKTALFSVVHGHYQFGTIQNLIELGEVCHTQKIFFHTDAAQTFATQEINVQTAHIDLLTATAAKIYGPKGIALLYIREGTPIQPLIYGGGQERGLRSSTLDTPLIVGFAQAARLAAAHATTENSRLIELRDHLIKRVLAEIPHTQLNGHPQLRLPNNAHFSISGAEGEALLFSLDAAGIAASTGSACSSHNLQPDHSLLAIGLGPAAAHGSLRLTLGASNDLAQINYCVDQLKIITTRLRALSPLKI